MDPITLHLEALLKELKESTQQEKREEHRTVHDAKLDLAFHEGWDEMQRMIFSAKK